MVCYTVVAFSAILIVDNNNGAPAPYSTITAAIAAANDGDTIYVQPSATTYGNFTINKRLIIIGGGAYPLKQNTTTTKTGGILLEKASSGTIIMGFFIDGNTPYYGIKANIDSLSNILIANCYIIRGIQTGKGVNAWIIEGCVFANNGFAIDIISGSNLLIQNNIMSSGGASSGDGAINLQSGSVSNIIIKK